LKAAQESPMTDALKARLTDLRASGFNRLYQRDRIFEFSTPESILDLDFTLPVFVLVVRHVLNDNNEARIAHRA
jgi:excinuclease ABC subunit A